MNRLALISTLIVAAAIPLPNPPQPEPLEGTLVCEATSPVVNDPGVTCCCNTRNGMCCAEVAFCGGYVPGCMCSGRVAP